MQIRLSLMILALIFLSCAHRELQLPEPTPSATNASQVTIIRESPFFHFGIPLTVVLDDAIICKLRAGEYVTFTIEPGFHTLGLSESALMVPFATKQNYYFLIKTSPDKFGFEIERIDDGIGVYLISISKVLE
jgi:hypothetical protein